MNTPSIISIAYAEDQPIVRKGVIGFIEEDSDLKVTIEAREGIELIDAIRQAEYIPDLCILDINMAGMNGFDTLIALNIEWPEIKVLVFSVFELDIYIIRMI